jgi:polysaccharide pyruvyl transferase WcaK-like protein
VAKYFVYGYYGFGNFGDDLLLDVLVARIRQSDPDAEFVIRVREPIPVLAGDAKVRFLFAESILEQQGRSRFVRFRKYRAALMAEARRCDVMVVGGGTLFIDKGRFNWSLLFVHEAVRAAKRAGRKVVVTGVAIDILAHPLSLWLTRRIFSMADFSAVRDSLSLAYFQDWKSPPVLSADLVWLKDLPVAVRPVRGRRAVGLNFIDYFRSSTQLDEGHRAYRSSLLRLIERHRHECDFHLIALQKGLGQRDDWFAEEFREIVPQGRLIYIDSEQSLCPALESVDAVVTTRFHLALLAARAGVATCIVDHELKLTSLAQDLALPSVPLAEFLLVDGADPIERLRSWDPEVTRRAAGRMGGRAVMNFAWMRP